MWRFFLPLTFLTFVTLLPGPTPAVAAGPLTLPISGFAVGSWFDHTSPSGYGLTDNSSTMTRYDGTTGWFYNGHAGLDYPTGGVEGYNVVASAGGVVTAAGWASDGFGYRVRLWHEASPGFTTLYAHLRSNPVVSNGQSVSRGQLLGYSGNTGQSSGPHLHFGVYNSQSGWTPVDPYGWSGGGSDPWSPDNAYGYLWISNPPQPAPTYYDFQTWLLHTGTPLEKTISGQWTYAVADWNRDGSPDLVGIRMSGTASGMTEVHILSGAANFQIWLLHTATPLELTNATYWAFAMADWNREGTPDLVVVKKQGATSTEVHILSGAANFQTWLLHTSTPLEKTSYNWRFEAGDYNRDGVPDLYGIKMYATGSHSTELHILSGASNFGSWLLHTATPLEETVVGSWAFAVADWSLDVSRAPDFWIIKEDNTGTGSTEVHMLSGESNFQTWLIGTGTPLETTNNTYWQFDGGDYDRNQVPDLNIIKLSGASSTEMYVLGG